MKKIFAYLLLVIAVLGVIAWLNKASVLLALTISQISNTLIVNHFIRSLGLQDHLRPNGPLLTGHPILF